jgi:hypothetical protein
MTSLLLIPNISPNKIEYASFHSITTHDDGSVGIQISRDLQRLTIQDDVTTHGGEGESLVKGKVLELKAYALSVLKNDHVGELSVGGALCTIGQGVVTLIVQGSIDSLKVHEGIHALGQDSDAVVIEGGNISLEGLDITAREGERIRIQQLKK